MFLRLATLLFLLPVICFGQETVSYKACDKMLRQQGFHKFSERDDEDNLFYGYCLDGFYSGKYDGNPAVLKVTASQNTRTVFNVELILREFVDAEEAAEAGNRLIADVGLSSQIAIPEEIELKGTLVELPNGRKRTYKSLCFEQAGKLWRLPDGVARMTVLYNNLEREYIVRLNFYDSAAGKLAEDEAGKFNRKQLE